MRNTVILLVVLLISIKAKPQQHQTAWTFDAIYLRQEQHSDQGNYFAYIPIDMPNGFYMVSIVPVSVKDGIYQLYVTYDETNKYTNKTLYATLVIRTPGTLDIHNPPEEPIQGDDGGLVVMNGHVNDGNYIPTYMIYTPKDK
jgi:hypothetical protein